ncbi:MAG: hypothetical protein ACKO1F_09210 [Flammeovirgaceae bacterium]
MKFTSIDGKHELTTLTKPRAAANGRVDVIECVTETWTIYIVTPYGVTAYTEWETTCSDSGGGGSGGFGWGLDGSNNTGGTNNGSSNEIDPGVVAVNDGGINGESQIIIQAPSNEKKINDKKEYLKCFDTTKVAKLTIFADQPVPDTRRAWAFPKNVGHSFITLEQNVNGTVIRRTFGFYPNESATPFDKEDDSALFDDSGHVFDVSVSFEISPKEISGIVNYTLSKMPATYHLDDFNCTNFVVSSCENANLNLPQNSGNWVVGKGLNPGGFGQDLRKLNLPSKTESKDLDGGVAEQNSGTCN